MLCCLCVVVLYVVAVLYSRIRHMCIVNPQCNCRLAVLILFCVMLALCFALLAVFAVIISFDSLIIKLLLIEHISVLAKC